MSSDNKTENDLRKWACNLHRIAYELEGAADAIKSLADVESVINENTIKARAVIRKWLKSNPDIQNSLAAAIDYGDK